MMNIGLVKGGVHSLLHIVILSAIIGALGSVVTMLWAWNFLTEAWLQNQLSQLWSYSFMGFYGAAMLSTHLKTRHLDILRWPYFMAASIFFFIGSMISLYIVLMI